jgi:hypothetical protein
MSTLFLWEGNILGQGEDMGRTNTAGTMGEGKGQSERAARGSRREEGGVRVARSETAS